MAFVHLFEWSWDDIANECETFLAPKGFTAVQVSPPQEHMSGAQWWTRYQPVSYKLVSRSGNEAQFASMVQRCNAVGVGIYVDAVINHMAAGGGTGTAGSQYGNRNFPIYSPRDFHHDHWDEGRNCQVSNYSDKHNVQYCDLVGLADLCTGCGYVQETIANYIKHLKSLGVAGFRVDAAKHIDAGELGGILGRVGNMYRFLEVIGHGGEAVGPAEYYHLGQVTEFNYAIKVAEKFKHAGAGLQYLANFGEEWGLMPHRSAVTFVDNHDTQRGHAGEAALTHKSGPAYRLASIFMLAHPYGYPKIMSSYHFQDTDAGPPGRGVSNNCGYGKDWTCEHRWDALANMVAWRKSGGDAWISDWTSHGPDQIAFCRGGRACVAINRMEHGDWQATLRVSVPAGEYCNIIKSDASDCERVRVQGDGTVSVRVAPMDAVAFHVGKMVGGGDSPSPTPSPQRCDVPDHSKEDCGWMGVDQYQCESRGCCWAPSNNGKPWCFHASR
jgi:alpha-amylase